MKHCLALLLAISSAAWSEVKEIEFGTTKDGKTVHQYILSNRHGLEARVMTYGATWTNLVYPDGTDVLLGFDDLSGYLGEHPYFGSTVGRVANRIARGQFELDGKSYRLAINNGPNHLHGGLQGLDKVVWSAEPLNQGVCFRYRDADGHNGYPGNVEIQVTYTLNDEDELRIDYSARADQATPINLTNHAYFNLAGGGTILDQELWLNAPSYTPVDDTLIPTGQILPVAGGAFDFTTAHAIGRDLQKAGGYDHNFVVAGSGMRPVARVRDPKSGRQLEISSDQPGVQFYTGNFLDGKLSGKKSAAYPKNGAFCLETQHFPDSVHHSNFPDSILRPGQEFSTSTVHKFSWKKS